MTKKALLVFGCAAVGVAGLLLSMVVVPRVVPDRHAQVVAPVSAKAHWAEHFNSLRQMRASADVIVLARHIAAQPGRVEDAPADPLPFTNNWFETVQAIKGHPGASLVVEQTGGALEGVEYSIDDGGPYAAGGRYLLFLKKQPDTSYYYLINAQGRFYNEGGKLKAVVRDAATSRLHGKPEAEALAALKAN